MPLAEEGASQEEDVSTSPGDLDPAFAHDMRMHLITVRSTLEQFQHSRSIDDASTVLVREAMLILQERGEYEVIPGGFLVEETPREGFIPMTRAGPLGLQLFYIPKDEFQEFAEVKRRMHEAAVNKTRPAMDEALARQIEARVEGTIEKGSTRGWAESEE